MSDLETPELSDTPGLPDPWPHAPIEPITPPRDLAMPGRLLRSALSLLDHVNPFLVASPPKELEFDALDRDGQVAGLWAMRAAMEEGLNARRRAEWRLASGHAEAVGPLTGVQPSEGPHKRIRAFRLVGERKAG